MKRTTLATIIFLLIVLLGCGDNNPPKRTMSLTVSEDAGSPSSGASVQVYSSTQQWLNGETPLLTGNTNASGVFESFQALPDGGLVVFAEKNTKNNWPTMLDRVIPKTPEDGVYWGSASVSESLYPEVKSASTKSFLLTDFKNSSGISIFASLPACNKDNFIKLGLDQKMTINEATDVCPGKTAQTVIVYSAIVNKSAPMSYSGQAVYPIALVGQAFQMYINVSFTTIFLTELGNDAVYTRQN